MQRSELIGLGTAAAERPEDLLDQLATRVSRLCPDHRDPHRFHEEKSEIAFELTMLARSTSR